MLKLQLDMLSSGVDSIGHGGTRVPTFTNGWAQGDTVSRRTANKKLAKLYSDHHESAHQND